MRWTSPSEQFGGAWGFIMGCWGSLTGHGFDTNGAVGEAEEMVGELLPVSQDRAFLLCWDQEQRRGEEWRKKRTRAERGSHCEGSLGCLQMLFSSHEGPPPSSFRSLMLPKVSVHPLQSCPQS